MPTRTFRVATLACVLLLAGKLLLRPADISYQPATSPALIAGTGLTSSPPATEKEAITAAALANFPGSLRDTTIDGNLHLDADGNLVLDRNLRHLFDYFLTTTGEESLPQIRDRLHQLFQKQLSASAAAQATAALTQYLDYLQALQSLPDDTQFSATLDTTLLRQRKQAERDLRAQHLSSDLAEVFFAQEDAFDDYSLALVELQRDTSLDILEKEARIGLLQENLPYELRQQIQTSQQLNHAMRLSTSAEQQNWSPAELQQQREKLLGADAAERLAQLDQERAHWNEQLQSYLQQRSTLLDNANLASADRASALTDLRSQFFSDTDRLRVIALEHLHDSQP